jgi:sulfur-carrier protein
MGHAPLVGRFISGGRDARRTAGETPALHENRLYKKMIRVVLPFHLRTLAQVSGEVALEVPAPVTQRAVLDALEERYPMLRGTIRDHVTQERRAFLRFFACEEDLSHGSPDAALPDAVAAGKEPFVVLGAIAGG